jgi:ubiquinone/menaquinone biosynthesis C-methylase UbiE
MAEVSALHYPGEALRAFGSDDVTRRVGKLGRLGDDSRVLHLGCGTGALTLLLAREFGCSIVAADTDAQALETLREKARSENLSGKIEVKKLEGGRLPFEDAEFEAVLVDGMLPGPLPEGVASVRRLLGPSGRLCLIYPVRVGRHTYKPIVDFWHRKLGESLRSPRDLLQLLEQSGFEPHGIETMSDVELDDFYRTLETQLDRCRKDNPALAEVLSNELEQYRGQGGKACVSFALAVARRKEPGERPPAAGHE